MVKKVTARKRFVVVAYDIADEKRRNRVVKILEAGGIRINYSVFECFLTESRLAKLQEQIADVIEKQSDTVVYYLLCVNCYTKIVYQPDRRHPPETVRMV